MDPINVSTAATVVARDILPFSKNFTDEKQLKNIDTVYTILCQLISKHIDKMREQSVANSLWSLGKAVDILGPQKKEEFQIVFESLCARAMIVSNYLNTQGTSNILWAMAKFQWDDQQQIQRIVRQAVSTTKKNYQPQEIVNILWAMATLKYQNLQATKHFVDLAKQCVHDMNEQLISNLLWSLQQLRFYDQELNLEVENLIINSNKKFSSQSISNLTLAFTDIGLQNKQKILDILVHQFTLCNPPKLQELSNFLYSLSLLDCPLNLSQKIIEKYFTDESNDIKPRNFSDIHLRQLKLAQIFYSIRKQELLFPPDFEESFKKCLRTYYEQIKENSFLDDVFSVIQNNFKLAKKNVLICDDQIEIHIAIQQKEKNKVAVDVNATQSYFVNCREKLLGRCQHHVFLLEQLGWLVVQVSAFEWNIPQYKQHIINDIKEKLAQ